jgi:hypothetical protein
MIGVPFFLAQLLLLKIIVSKVIMLLGLFVGWAALAYNLSTAPSVGGLDV